MTTSETGEQTSTGNEPAEPRSPEEIEAEIEQTRHDLGETVDALSAKLDVKSRAREQVAVSKQKAADQVQVVRQRASESAAKGKDAVSDEEGNLKPVVPAAGAGAALLAVAIVVAVVRRRRRRVVLVGPLR